MKRSTPLRRTSLDRGTSQLKRTPIKARSNKRARVMSTGRAPAVRELLAAGVMCEIGPLLAAAGVHPFRCHGAPQGLHERRKRSSAGSLTTGENLIPACNWCNGWVEDNPGLARELFATLLVVREGDPEWERLGARTDGAPLVIRQCEECGVAYVTRPGCGH